VDVFIVKLLLHRKDAKTNPYLIWNEFIRVLATTPTDELDCNQQIAQLVFFYDSEVQNGGHQQYLTNRPSGSANDVLAALCKLGASAYATILSTAAERWAGHARETPKSVQDYVACSLEMEFADLDAAYYSTTPTITSILEQWLDKHMASMVELID
jgi:hypothetical protein